MAWDPTFAHPGKGKGEFWDPTVAHHGKGEFDGPWTGIRSLLPMARVSFAAPWTGMRLLLTMAVRVSLGALTAATKAAAARVTRAGLFVITKL